MSINELSRIASGVHTQKDVARYLRRVSRAYVRGLMSTAEYLEYRRYIQRAGR